MAKASTSKAVAGLSSSKTKRLSTSRPSSSKVKASKQPGGKAAKLRPAGLSAVAKGKQRASDVQEKPKGKRKREQDDENAQDGDNKKKRSVPVLVRSVKRLVTPSAAKSWRKLSRAGQAELRATLEEGALEILSQLDGKAKNDLQILLRELYEEIEDYFSELLVPAADPSCRLASGSATKGEVDILGADTVTERTAAHEAALVPELAEVRALERAIKMEQRLLEEDEARLLDFESARLNVEAAERKESSKNMHPLLRELLDSRAAPLPETTLFDRKKPSSLWIAESARSRLPREKPARLEEEDEDDEPAEESAEYDPTEDDFLISLAQRVAGPLAEVEKRLEGLSRIERIVNEGERAVVGMM